MDQGLMMSYFIALVRSDVLKHLFPPLWTSEEHVLQFTLVLSSCETEKKKKKKSSKLAATGLTDMTSSVKEDNKGAAHLIFNVVIHLT